jgi:glucose/mannose-6-phosphate isomerase
VTIGVIEYAALRGTAPGLHAEIDTATALLERLVEEWGPGAGDDSLAKSVARQLVGTIPVMYGASATIAPARRWSSQLNENAGVAAFWTELPEANHNQICGWEQGRELAPLSGVFLCDPDQHPRVQRHVDLAAAELERVGAPTVQVHTRGDSRLERVLSAVLLGDLVSIYMAILAGVDPTETPALSRLKQQL